MKMLTLAGSAKLESSTAPLLTLPPARGCMSTPPPSASEKLGHEDAHSRGFCKT